MRTDRATSSLVVPVILLLIVPGLFGPGNTLASTEQTQTPAAGAQRLLPAVAGVVRDSRTRLPIAGAIVRLGVGPFGLGRAGGGVSQQRTDATGRFLFTRVGAGTQVLVATAFGYLPSNWNLHDRTLHVSRTDGLLEIDVVLTPAASVSGFVVDHSGEPIAGAFVRPLLVAAVDGHQVLAAGPVAITDDRGFYHLQDLPAGRYLIEMPSVQEVDAADTSLGRIVMRANGYPLGPASSNRRAGPQPRHYYPGVTAPERAREIELTAGESFEAANVVIAPVAGFIVSGTIAPVPAAGQPLTLLLSDASVGTPPHGSEVGLSRSGPDGRFVFANIPPGRYTIKAVPGGGTFSLAHNSSAIDSTYVELPGRRSTTTLPVFASPEAVAFSRSLSDRSRSWAVTLIDVVDRDRTDVVVPIHDTGSIDGVVTLATRSDAGIPELVGVSIEPAMTNEILTATGRVLTTATSRSRRDFAVEGLIPGRYFVKSATPGLTIRSVIGSSVTDPALGEFVIGAPGATALTVEMTADGGAVSGTLTRAGGTGANSVAVFCLPRPPRGPWAGFQPHLLQMVYAAPDGSFGFIDLPAGDYVIAALDAADRPAVRTASQLESLAPTGTRVTVLWGQNVRVAVPWPQSSGR